VGFEPLIMAYLQRRQERAIARTQPSGATPGRYRAPDHLLAFLEAL